MARYPYVPAKVGTVPMLVWLRSRKPPVIGAKIQYRDIEGGKWKTGLVTSAAPLKLDQF